MISLEVYSGQIGTYYIDVPSKQLRIGPIFSLDLLPMLVKEVEKILNIDREEEIDRLWREFKKKLELILKERNFKVTEHKDGTIVVETQGDIPIAIIKPAHDKKLIMIDTLLGLNGLYPTSTIYVDEIVKLLTTVLRMI